MISSALAGVQAKINQIYPLTLYTHCFAHSLSLSIAASCSVQDVKPVSVLIFYSSWFL